MRTGFRINDDVRQYGDLLIGAIVGELPDILSNEYDPDGRYRANFMSGQKNMVAELKRDGRREPNYALDWWRSVDNSSVIDLRKKTAVARPAIPRCRARLTLRRPLRLQSDSSGTLGTGRVLVGK